MKFAYAKTHPLVDPDWLVVIDTPDLLFEFHKRVTVRLALKYGADPHLFDERGHPKNHCALIMSPVNLGSKWLSSAERFYQEHGKVYMNRAGGLCPSPHVLKYVDSAFWPASHPMEGEVVYISKYPNGNHYYLRSTTDRIFPVEKCHSYAEAVDMATKFAPGAEVRQSKAYGQTPVKYLLEGD